ncbi:Alanine racemase [Sulfurimonas denitrificans DSM 1251]|jgi:alanine racemase|uniref:Alanine racemase n=1 Tax=Sulfurimonas denitrificans (strain ATCC 33889 / DSM 1251) TaxID=326298 RepID=Q30TM1_SULDN|nr:alanine racemase [Sulfurimonas denitrificans]ABB43660.1 Alanine racemase [Sulfurimonas denitrificans DSM 1251]MDD3442550.1 alanine racemase [Sulfurimonas denitrificans]
MATIILNKNNFFNNLDIIAKYSKSVDKIALVLKDNAYGHGLVEMSSMAKEYGIKRAVVRTHREAEIAESFFSYILVLGDIPTMVSKTIRYTINDLESIDKFPKETRVELKIDSGMHRNGIAIDEIEEAFIKIKARGLLLEGLFTHHRSADELTSEWFWQKKNFEDAKRIAKELAIKYGFAPLRFHSSNSAALFRNASFDEDMARVGIAAYGCMTLPKPLHVDGFKPVLSLWAKKLSSRKLKSHQRVGYGGDGEILSDGVVSNYDFGYGEGFLRVCANGYKTPEGIELIGRISMDNSSFLSSKDKLLIFDSALHVATYASTISYEVLTSLKPEIKREIF